MTEVKGIVYDFDARRGVVAIEIHTPVGADKVVRFPTDESWELGEEVVVRVERAEPAAELVSVKMPSPMTEVIERELVDSIIG